MSEQLTDLPKIIRRAWATMSTRTAKALEILEAADPRPTIPCNECEGPREILMDKSVAMTARELRKAEVRYEPCRDCHPWKWYEHRATNVGVPPTQPVCTVQRDQMGEVTMRKLGKVKFPTKSPHLYITGSQRRAVHAVIMTTANGWFVHQAVLEQCAEQGAANYVNLAIAHPYLLAVAVSSQDRGEFLPKICQREARTWVIDPEECARPLIPQHFFNVTA